MTPSSKPESALIEEFLLTGDRTAFGELAGRHAGFIRRTLYLKLRNMSETDDACQDVLIAMFRSLKNFSGRSSLATWIYRICGNVASDVIRKKERERKRMHILRLFASDSDPRDDDTPHWVNEREADVDIVLASLDSLGEPDRTILYLRDAEGLAVDDIALAFGIPSGTVKSKLSRSREKLKKNPDIRMLLDLEELETEVNNEKNNRNT